MRLLAAVLLFTPFASVRAADWRPPSVRSVWAQAQAALPPAKDARKIAQSKTERAGRPALPKDALRVPIHQQETDYSCGAASLLTVLRYWQAFNGKERDLYGPLETDPKEGTEPKKIVEVARKLGLKAEMKTRMSSEDLRSALGRKETVILDIQAWREEGSAQTPWEDLWEDGHYIVLIAMDDKNAFFMDPVLDDSYAYIPLGELPGRWHDYESRHGAIERYFQLGILLSGTEPLPHSPLPSKKPVLIE